MANNYIKDFAISLGIDVSNKENERRLSSWITEAKKLLNSTDFNLNIKTNKETVTWLNENLKQLGGSVRASQDDINGVLNGVTLRIKNANDAAVTLRTSLEKVVYEKGQINPDTGQEYKKKTYRTETSSYVSTKSTGIETDIAQQEQKRLEILKSIKKINDENFSIQKQLDTAIANKNAEEENFLRNKQKELDYENSIQNLVSEYGKNTGYSSVEAQKELDILQKENVERTALYQARQKDAAAKQLEEKQTEALISSYNQMIEAQVKLIDVKSNRYRDKGELDEAKQAVDKTTTSFEQQERAILGSNGAFANAERTQTAYANGQKKVETATDKANKKMNAQKINLSTLSSKLKESATNLINYSLGYRLLSRLDNVLRDSIGTIKELDDALTNVRIVTGETNEQVKETIQSYAELGQQLGATTKDVAEGSIEWLRQGKTVEETTILLTQSTKLSKLGAMDAREATEKLTASLNGFNLSAKDAESIVDKLISVDLAYATSADEIATALQYVASSAGLANVSLDKMIGMITVVSETTRKSAETIGNS